MTTRRLKIFHINMHHHWGGQPNRVLTESRGLAELGHEVWVAGPKDCILVQRAREAGLKTFDGLELMRGFRPASFMRDYKALKALFERERFDIVHPHGSQDSWVSVFAGRAVTPRPHFVRTRHNIFKVAGHLPNRWLYRHFEYVITIAPQVDELISIPLDYPSGHIRAIYSAPDPGRFDPRPANPKLREEFGIPEGVPVFGKVARLAPEKGHELFLGAAAKVIGEIPEARFMCVGKGRSRNDIEALAHELGIEKNVILTGFREDVPDCVALFDVFCLTPTAGESLGTSILEGFLMAKPAIATQVGGTGESVRNGRTGFLIAPAPPEIQIEKLAEAMLTLARDPELRRKMGDAGRAMALEEFSPRRLAEQCEEIYLEIAK